MLRWKYSFFGFPKTLCRHDRPISITGIIKYSLIAIFSYWHLFPRLIFLGQFFPLIYFPKDMFSQWLFFLFTSFPTDFFSYRHVFQVSFFPNWHFFLFSFPNLEWKNICCFGTYLCSFVINVYKTHVLKGAIWSGPECKFAFELTIDDGIGKV